MAWKLCTSALAIVRAGANAPALTASGTELALISDAVEGTICGECHTDFVADYTSLPARISGALADVASSMIAQDIVAYDPTGYLRREADTLMNLNDARIKKGLAYLKDKTKQRFST